MTNRDRLFAVLVALQVGLSTNCAPPGKAEVSQSPLRHGYWSAAAWDVSVSVTNAQVIRIPSTDGRFYFVAQSMLQPIGNGEASVPEFYVERERRRVGQNLPIGAIPEMAWAPNSHRFFVSSSRGGSVGTWKLFVYSIVGDRVEAWDVGGAVRKNLRSQYPPCVPFRGVQPCPEEERAQLAADASWVNVVGIKWLGTSGQLLVVALVPNSSGYGANMAKWLGYRIEVPSGAILQRYTPAEFLNEWGTVKGKWK
jgi:hypothetical protein